MFYLLILGAVCHGASVEVRGQLAESVLSFYNWHQTHQPDSASQAIVDD